MFSTDDVREADMRQQTWTHLMVGRDFCPRWRDKIDKSVTNSIKINVTMSQWFLFDCLCTVTAAAITDDNLTTASNY